MVLVLMQWRQLVVCVSMLSMIAQQQQLTHYRKLKKDLAQKLEEARERWPTCSPYRSVRGGLIVSSRAQEVLAYRRG